MPLQFKVSRLLETKMDPLKDIKLVWNKVENKFLFNDNSMQDFTQGKKILLNKFRVILGVKPTVHNFSLGLNQILY